MTMSTHAEKSALDEFLPEAVFTAGVRQGVNEPSTNLDVFLPPGGVQLDPIEAVAPAVETASANTVEMWPMLAAALVAIGVSMLALAVIAKFGFSS
jgi:hypothetical protein